MIAAIAPKLLAIVLAVAVGWWLGQRAWRDRLGEHAARVLSNLAFYLFVPALLFRTVAQLDLAALPWRTLTAYFIPAIGYALVVYAWQRRQRQALSPAAPAACAVIASYGNAAQLGIPLSAALFGEAGLAIHIALVSVHSVLLLSLLTVLAEFDLARADPASTLRRAFVSTVRNTVGHPVVMPVLAGALWNLTGLGLAAPVDEALLMFGRAAVPVCLLLIGLTLAQYGVRSQARGSLQLAVLKLGVLPALVLISAHWGFGLSGLPLAVLVAMAALPTGSNALIFAQRYGVLQREATAAIVVSTLVFSVTLVLWLAAAAALGP